MLEVVSNSGPFIHINDINRIKLLHNLSRIYIPDKVFKEVGNILLKLNNVEVVKVSPTEIKSLEKKLNKFKLQEAEKHALYLAKKLDKIFLTDDLSARDAAKKLGIVVHGTIGVIALLYKRGAISMIEAKKLINELYYKSSLFISKAIVDIAIKKLSK